LATSLRTPFVRAKYAYFINFKKKLFEKPSEKHEFARFFKSHERVEDEEKKGMSLK